ncbi:hypothetical protein WICMUC_000194 [Wickerhamomyces mucosus]|uniref:Glycosyltransferase family 34 protein n=1 Tax=Wickerhamomyces mucosus TaxID=1378264 RepID=A0A9P8PZW6_9ASCO|nr:hypothetical protein WICMUC_000194 [Wickerhamomyces mucosus]
MQLSYNNKFKPQKNANQFFLKLKKSISTNSIILIILSIIIISLYILSIQFNWIKKFGWFGSHSNSNSIIPLHGYYKDDILTKNTLIFPSIEHAPLLRELGIDGLFESIVDPQGLKHYKLTDSFDSEDSLLNNKLDDESTNQMLKIKNSFLNHGKLKFNGGNTPEIIIVTGVDFEKYELSHLTKIVQNRVNYAQRKNYGIYVRWLQEFIPLLENSQQSKEWCKIFLIRAAMYTFPNAKYFWYLDEDAIIMNYNIDLYKYLLHPKALEPIMLKDQPIIPPNGVIHTFKNTKAENVELILTQIGQDLNLNSFIIKNGFYSKSLLEFWSDKLFRNYHNFPGFAESAITHILQWHPVYLARTALIPPRTIASLHSAIELKDDIHYNEGDFVASLRDCQSRKSCESEIDLYWSKTEN